jgi:hypothetical protein
MSASYRLSSSLIRPRSEWHERLFASLVVVGCGFAVACGNTTDTRSTGVVEKPLLDDSSYLDELTETEAAELCAYTQTLLGGPGKLTCSDDSTVTVDDVDQCIASFAKMHCVVGDCIDCVESASSACDVETTAECTAFLECETKSGNSG